MVSYSGVYQPIIKSYLKSKKRIIRINMNSDNKDSCRDLFKKLNILPLQSQYIFSLLMYVVKNKDLLKNNSEVHSFNTRSHYDLHIPAANLAVFQNAVWYCGIKIYNHLPPTIKQLSYDISKFKAALNRFLYTNSFYTLEEYYSSKQRFCLLTVTSWQYHTPLHCC
jgi:hypothetical protein